MKPSGDVRTPPERVTSDARVASTPTEAQRIIRQTAREANERALAECIKRAGLPVPNRQFAYLTGRRVRADFAYPLAGLLIEVQGGEWGRGHSRGDRYAEDRIKIAEAQLAGWIVIEVTPTMIADGRAVDLIERALMARHGITKGDV